MPSDPAPEFRQLLPAPAAVGVDELLAGADLPALATPERPYTVVNFISSADGRASFKGRSGPLGDEADRAVFHELREHADAVLAGTGTLATEHYGRILGRPERRQRRIQRGLPAEPLACIITRRGQVPRDLPLLDCAEARVVLFTAGSPPDTRGWAADVTVHQVSDEDTLLASSLHILRREHGVRVLLCEGGPTLFGALLADSLVDELFLTVAPKLVGGGHELPMALGAEPGEMKGLAIRWLLERDGSLFLRYALG